MGVFKSIFKFLNYIITLGGSEELECAQNEYNKKFSLYEQAHAELSRTQEHIEKALSNIGDNIERAKLKLDLAEKSLNSKYISINSMDDFGITVNDIKSFNLSFNNALTVGFGGALGGTIAVGAWAFVSVIGSASTGTAIFSLSGIAATNATLAWFGGGALAAGGAGMSGGMMVLGGIVAAPMIYFATKGAYAKAEKIRKEAIKINNEHKRITELQPQAEEQLRKIKLHKIEICNICTKYCNESARLLKVIYPYGFMSKFIQKVYSLFNINGLSSIQESALSALNIATANFLQSFSKIKK